MRNIVLLTLLDFYEGSRSLFLWSIAEVGMGVLFYFLKCNKPYVVFVIEKTITVNYSICTSKSSWVFFFEQFNLNLAVIMMIDHSRAAPEADV